MMDNNQITLKALCKRCSGQGGQMVYDEDAAEYPGDEWHWKKCRFCEGSRFIKTFVLGHELELAAIELLETCDWYVDYSDSLEIQRKENAKLSLVHQLLALLEQQVAIKLWKQYSSFNLPFYLQ